MGRGRRWWYGVMIGVALPLSGGLAAAATPAGSAQVEGQVWPETPVQPWDETAATGEPWADVLNQSFSLTRRGRAGERHRYQFRRQNLLLDREGRTVQRTLFEGTVRQTLQEEREPGLWAERIEWERFGMGQAQGPTDRPVVKDVAGARGFAFDYYPPTFDYLNPPGDYAKLGDPMTGYGLKVAMMDVAGFSALVMGVREDPKRPVRIGETRAAPRWQQGLAIKPGSGAGVGGDYRLGVLTVSVAGLTRRSGEPCVLLWFTAEGNEVTQDTENPQLTMRMRGTEYFRGTLALSARDGHVVGGELWGPLPATLVMGFGGQPATEQPSSGFMQQVSLWEIR